MRKARAISPAVVMGAPDRLGAAASVYLSAMTTKDNPPTFEGLALACGFHSFNQMRSAIINDAHPQASRDTLVIACAHIADMYQKHGLTEQLNPSFIKYLLSAYLNISEKHLTESTGDTTITLRWADNPGKAAADPSTKAKQAQLRQAAATTKSLEQELEELEIEEIM